MVDLKCVFRSQSSKWVIRNNRMIKPTTLSYSWCIGSGVDLNFGIGVGFGLGAGI